MKNKSVSYLIIAIIFILFSVIAFLLPFDKDTLFYTGYIFSVISFVVNIFVISKIVNKKDLNGKFLNLPIGCIAISYLIIQVIAFIGLNTLSCPLWLSLIIYLLILGISLVIILGTSKGISANENLEKEILEKKNFLKNIEFDLEFTLKKEKDSDIQKSLKDLIEKVKFSDPMSHESLKSLEDEIIAKVEKINDADNKLDIINDIDLLLEKRNKKTQMLKK